MNRETHKLMSIKEIQDRRRDLSASYFEKAAQDVEIVILIQWWGQLMREDYRPYDCRLLMNYIHGALMFGSRDLVDDFQFLNNTVRVMMSESMEDQTRVFAEQEYTS